jgi:hypothetical protein
VLGALLGVDRSVLAPDEAITFVQVLARQLASLAAVEVEATAIAASGHPLTQELYVGGDAAFNAMLDRHEFGGAALECAGERVIRIHDAVREELASAVRISQQEAHTRIQAARLLTGPLLRTLDALSAGEISARHAVVVVVVVADAAARLPGADAVTSLLITDAQRADLAPVLAAACTSLQDRVLPTARRTGVALTRQRANRAVLAIDPPGQERRRRQARCTRDVWVTAEQDGHCLLMARMATARALACLSAIDAAATTASPADPTPADPGPAGGHVDATIGERRVDALDAMIQSGPCHAPGPAAHTQAGQPTRVRVHVDVTIPLDALLALSQAPGQMATGRGPRIDATATEVRDLLADPSTDATLRRLVTDPMTGHLLDAGRHRYPLTTALRDFIARRDTTCRFPGCPRRATHCQIDDGTCTWRSPHGRRYTTPTHPVLDPPDDPDPDPAPA